MAKKLLNLCMAMVMVLVLLPTKATALEIIGAKDCSEYLTDNVLRPEELTLDGILFCELTIEESIKHLPSTITQRNEIIHADESFVEEPYRQYGTRMVNSEKTSAGFASQNDDSTVLNVFNYGYARKSEEDAPLKGLNVGVRNICIGDSMKSVLEKIGVLSMGADYVIKILEESAGKAAYYITKGNEKSSSEIRFYDGAWERFQVIWRYDIAEGNLQVRMHFEDNVLTCFSMHYYGTSAPNILKNPGRKVELQTEFIYDSVDSGENTKFPSDLLDKVTDSKSAADAVKQMTDGMTSEQKSSPTGIDLATLYAETAVSKAASKEVKGEVIISADSVVDVEDAAKQAASAVETALVNGGVTTARYLANTITLTTDETGEITIKIDPDILTTEVDKIRVETPNYALTLKTADLAEDLTEVLTIKAEEIGSGFAPGKANRKVTVKVTLPKGRTTNPVTISLPADEGAVTYQAVVKTDGSATSSKYNPATTTMDGKVNTSGTYTVQMNEKSFTDISNKSAEMQKAILYLTSKGIINGTSATTFSPNGTINRQQVAALLMRALGKVDNTATAAFKDVSAQSSLYHEIASSKKHKIVNGYSDNTFRGTNVISRAQIVTVAGRVLTSEMNYKVPSNASTYLMKYSDTVPDFAKEMVALATRENLVVYRTDGTFSGGKNMTRGDAAIILYRLFQRIW